MKYSRKQIDTVGRIIAAEPFDALEYAEAMKIVVDWRKPHLPILDFYGFITDLSTFKF